MREDTAQGRTSREAAERRRADGRKATGRGHVHRRRPRGQRPAPEPPAPSSPDTNRERLPDGGTPAARPRPPRAPRAPGPPAVRAAAPPRLAPWATPGAIARTPRHRPHLHALAVVQQHVPQLLGDHVELPFLPFRRSRQQIHPRERRIQGVKLPVYREHRPNFNERPWAASTPTALGPGNPCGTRHRAPHRTKMNPLHPQRPGGIYWRRGQVRALGQRGTFSP